MKIREKFIFERGASVVHSESVLMASDKFLCLEERN